MKNPIIVDLLSLSAIEIGHPKEAKVIGRFARDSATIDDRRTLLIRVAALIGQIGVDVKPDPLTFYISESWQCFAIVSALSIYYGVSPHVLVVLQRGLFVDLVDFYDKGGGELFSQGASIKPVEQVQTNL